MLFRDATLLTENQRVTAEDIFGCHISKELTPVPFDDGTHGVATLDVNVLECHGLGIQLLQLGWMSTRSSIAPNEAKLVWCDTIGDTPQWRVKYVPHISKTTIEAGSLSQDEIVILTTEPERRVYLFFKTSDVGKVSLVHPFAQFPVSKAVFTPEELVSLQSSMSVPAVETDYAQFKKLFDRVGLVYSQAYFTTASGILTDNGNGVYKSIGILSKVADLSRNSGRSEYATVFHFSKTGEYVGMFTCPN